MMITTMKLLVECVRVSNLEREVKRGQRERKGWEELHLQPPSLMVNFCGRQRGEPGVWMGWEDI